MGFPVEGSNRWHSAAILKITETGGGRVAENVSSDGGPGEGMQVPRPADPTAPGRRFVPPGKPRGLIELQFMPIENGVDYLLSVTEHLGYNPSTRDLKYAVLHLHAATEVLVKSRLQIEHWSLVFEKPEGASRVNFEKGEFSSCGTKDALRRLINIACIDSGVSEAAERDLATLTKWRNALQHYGLSIPAPAVEKLAANVLDFLLAFVRNELRPQLEYADRKSLDRQMESVSSGLASINKFLTTRLSRLRTELGADLKGAVCCPMCSQIALLFNGEAECRFCQMVWSHGGEAAHAYIEEVQGRTIVAGIRGHDFTQITECPECTAEALVSDVELGSGDVAEYLCFQCGTQQANLDSCDGCGVPTVADGGLSLCGSCLEAKIDRF
jgi:hypothetical protein